MQGKASPPPVAKAEAPPAQPAVAITAGAGPERASLLPVAPVVPRGDLEARRQELVAKLWPRAITDERERSMDFEYRSSTQAKDDSGALTGVLTELATASVGSLTAVEQAQQFNAYYAACRAKPASGPRCLQAADIAMANAAAAPGYPPGDLYAAACGAGEAGGCERGRSLASAQRVASSGDSGRLIASLCIAGDGPSCKAVESGNTSGWTRLFVAECQRLTGGKPAGPRADFACYQLVKTGHDEVPSRGRFYTGATLIGIGGVTGYASLWVWISAIPDIASNSYDGMPTVAASISGGALLVAGIGLLLVIFDQTSIDGAEEAAAAYRARQSAGGPAASLHRDRMEGSRGPALAFEGLSMRWTF